MRNPREIIGEYSDEGMQVLKEVEFDSAIVGVVRQFGRPPIACYDYNKIIEIIRSSGDISYEEAVEHFEFNIIGAYVGDDTPCFIEKVEDLDYEGDIE